MFFRLGLFSILFIVWSQLSLLLVSQLHPIAVGSVVFVTICLFFRDKLILGRRGAGVVCVVSLLACYGCTRILSYDDTGMFLGIGTMSLTILACWLVGRRIAILGDMLELGPEENRLHAALADELVAAGVDAVIACGRRMKHLHDALPKTIHAGYAQDAGEGLEQVKSMVQAGDVVLIKGSNGSGLHKIASVLVDGTAFGLTEA